MAPRAHRLGAIPLQKALRWRPDPNRVGERMQAHRASPLLIQYQPAKRQNPKREHHQRQDEWHRRAGQNKYEKPAKHDRLDESNLRRPKQPPAQPARPRRRTVIRGATAHHKSSDWQKQTRIQKHYRAAGRQVACSQLPVCRPQPQRTQQTKCDQQAYRRECGKKSKTACWRLELARGSRQRPDFVPPHPNCISEGA